MFKNKYPLFKRGGLIDKRQLVLLRDNSEELLNLMYMDRKDGIIKGFDVISNIGKREIIITKGVIKYRGSLYWLNKNHRISMPKEEDSYILKIRLTSDMENRRYYIRKGEVILTKEINVDENEIEITRFITRVGAELRNDYKNFKDLKRDFNLMEIINIKYSSENERGTLHPKILKMWGLEASRKENLDVYDINFYMNCLQGEVERETIISYINVKLEKTGNNYTNEELYENLLNILENLGNERKKTEKKRVVPKKIVID